MELTALVPFIDDTPPPMPDTSGLTERERAFLREYPVDFNATRAALRAGYGGGTNANTAAVKGHECLKHPVIRAALDHYLATTAQRANLTRERLLEELSIVAFSNIDDYTLDTHGNVALKPGANPKALRAISRIKKRVRFEKDENGDPSPVIETELYLWNKTDALSMAMKHKGMFIERKITATIPLEDMIKQLAAED